MIEFSQEDLKQLEEKGISKEKVLAQIETFKEGIPYIKLKKAAVVGAGILRFSERETQEMIVYFEKVSQNLDLLKFVPASGAASRMFKAMFNFLDTYNPSDESLDDYFDRNGGDKAVKQFLEEKERFPFYTLLMQRISDKAADKNEEAYLFVKEMLVDEGLNYGFYPKGLLPFHKYGEASATPFEEHLKEAAFYAKTHGQANLHFTISVQHNEMFGEAYKKSGPKVSGTTQTVFSVSYSNQKPATDTIAVDLENNPFKKEDGSILFRPGGHGALIENLNEQDADVIFIKNIDNVVVDKNLEAIGNSKKMLAGVLLRIQSKAFEYAGYLEIGEITDAKLQEIQSFLENEMNSLFSEAYHALGLEEKITAIKKKLNRPIRVCGMVKNEGEPGGGPFWIEDQAGNISLQIVESAQIDMSSSEQAGLVQNATHFNPVDIVCGIRDHKGKKYDLLEFVDHKQGFITRKTQAGKELKALELPGLWNGGMAFWNTLFVEVPLVTFNPVKTVNDLLKPTHQA